MLAEILLIVVVILILIAGFALCALVIPDFIEEAAYYFEVKNYKPFIINLFLLLLSIIVLVITAIFIIAIIATPSLFRSVF